MCREIARIQREQRREIRPGRVPDDEELFGVAAMLGDVALDPRDGHRDVLDVSGMHHARRQTMIHDDGHVPRRGKSLADKRLARLVSRAQRAAVNGDDDGRLRRARRDVDVEPVLLVAYSFDGT